MKRKELAELVTQKASDKDPLNEVIQEELNKVQEKRSGDTILSFTTDATRLSMTQSINNNLITQVFANAQLELNTAPLVLGGKALDELTSLVLFLDECEEATVPYKRFEFW